MMHQKRAAGLVACCAALAVLLASVPTAAEVVNLTPEGPIAVTPGTTTFGEVAVYVSGGTGLVGHDGVYPDGPSFAIAASTIDHYWVQGGYGTSPLTWAFSVGTQDVIVFAGIDHDPLPQESLEYILWGQNSDGSWEEGMITQVFRDGWDASTTADGLSDDYSAVWHFRSGHSVFRAAEGDHLDPHYGSADIELDGLAMIPEPGSLAALAMGIGAAAGTFRLRRRSR